jgi:hydrogenase nickel incorporation protein HypA/HybF
MHELPVTQGILDVVLKAAQANGAARITAIHLVVGELSSIVDDSVQFYFDMLSRDTIAQGAHLHFTRRAASATCLDCRHVFEVHAPLVAACPQCGRTRLRVEGGREFYVESIDVDAEAAPTNEVKE